MYDREQPFTGPVPSQYYMPVFSGEIEIRGMLPKEPQLRTSYILEQFYCLYNRDDRQTLNEPAAVCPWVT